jgi:hypothetical protein
MKWLRVFAGVLAVLIVALIALFFGARLHDGPIAIIPGGPLRSGEWVEPTPADWRFAKDLGEIELQLESQSTSRTTWILARDGVAYVPCSLSFPPGKDWYVRAQEDGRAVLRIGGRRYKVLLTRDDDPTLPAFARPEVERKYGAPPPTDAGVLFFRVEPRT